MKLVTVALMGALLSSTAFAATTPTPAVQYKKFCSSCHDTGTGNAPKFGNKDQWAPRIAKGNEALYNTAINGSKVNPLMLPRAGTKLSDGELKAIVDYMVAAAK